MSYLAFNLKGKQQTTADDIGGGQVDLPALSPGLFLELQFVKLHDHKGSNSRLLEAAATPEMVRGFRPKEREEHGVAEWTGVSSSSGSVSLTFAVPLTEPPDVFITPQDSNANIIIGTDAPTKEGVTIYWKDSNGTGHETLNLAWLAKAR